MSPEPPTPPASRGSALRADFLEVDTRWLALARVAFGVLLLAYVGSLVSDDRVVAYFSDEGVLPLSLLARLEPRHVAYSVFRFAHTSREALALFAIEALLAACVTVGCGTRVTAPLAWLGVIAIHHRIPFMVNGSMVTMHLLGILWVFLPLGRHASIDAWLARRRGVASAPYRLRSIAPLVLRLQLFAIYFFNAVQKSGATWRNGDAVHYVLYGSHSAWPWSIWLRTHEPRWFSPLATYSALVLETSIAVLMVLPAARARCRRLAVLLMAALHLGILALVDLGPFPFVFGLAALMLLSGEDGARLDRWLRIDAPTGAAPDAPRARLGARARESMLAVHLAASVLLNWQGNHAMRVAFGAPPDLAWLEPLAGPLYIPQAWAMFAPEAPVVDRLLMTAVELEDGRVVDVATRRTPSFTSLDARRVPVDFLLQTLESRVADLHDPGLIEAFARYQSERAEREGWLGRARIASVTVHELMQSRPARDASEAPPLRTRVLYLKRWLPREEPALFEP